MRTRISVLCAILLVQTPARESIAPAQPVFAYPCDDYALGLRRGTKFGTLIQSKGTPFSGTWHLADDLALAAGTPVRAIAAGVVRYSDFSPTWTDAKGFVHWNLGNVIVIEHELKPELESLAAVCSFYVHMAADRRVEVGELVERGQLIGRIGADRSEENGRYPAHLHLGIHRGAYVQITPAFERSLVRAAASKQGLRLGDVVLRGELELRRSGDSDVLISSKSGPEKALLSLLVGSTAPKDPPADIMNWCEGYGPKETLADWLEPSKFLARHAARAAK